MERTKEVINPEDQVIRWKKVGGGSLRFKGRIIKPGETFRASLNELPKSFRDVIIAQQEIPGTLKKPAAPVHKVVEPVYTVQARGKGGWYDVVDANGKALNEKALKKEVAEKLVKDLAK